MFNLKYLVVLFLILQTFAFNANASCSFYKYQRQFIKAIPTGLFEVQDFYPTGEKRSDPFLLTDETEARKKDYTVTFCGNSESTPILSIDGKYITYYKNGTKNMEGFYKKGYRIGKWQGWYESGKKFSETNYQDNKEFIGDTVYWHKNGLKMSEGKTRYIPGFMDEKKLLGQWERWIWSESGRLLGVWEESYDNDGSPIGIWLKRCNGIAVYMMQFKKGENIKTVIDIPSNVLNVLGCKE